MSLRQRLSGHRVLLMNVISLRASQRRAGRVRQCGHPTFVGLVADTRQLRLHRDARQRLISLLLIMLRRLMQIDRGLSHLRRVPERKRESGMLGAEVFREIRRLCSHFFRLSFSRAFFTPLCPAEKRSVNFLNFFHRK